jgi:hypothetical protein
MLTGASFHYVRDLAPAAWIRGRLHPFAKDVGSVVPEGFEAYVRLLHPAHRDGEPVAWRRIADANGCTIHSQVQFGNIAGSWQSSRSPQLWTRPPRPGTLPLEFARALVEILGSHTPRSERCWFAVWVGWGQSGTEGLPRFATDRREYYLASGPLDDALRGVYGESAGYQSASMWWPDDCSWFVSTEVDLAYTYVGGTRECVTAVAGHPKIEAVATRLTDGISWDSDKVNSSPGPPY